MLDTIERTRHGSGDRARGITYLRDINLPLARMVKDARAEAGLSQVQLAERLGVTREAVASIEIGKVGLPTLEVFRGLVRVLGLSEVRMLVASGYLPEAKATPLLNLEELRVTRLRLEHVEAESRAIQEILDRLERQGASPGNASPR